MAQNQAKAALNELFRTIATGDWSNFTSNLEKSVRLMKDFTNALDDYDTNKLRSKFIVSGIDAQIAVQRKLIAEYGKESSEAKKAAEEISKLQKERSYEINAIQKDNQKTTQASLRQQLRDEKITEAEITEMLKAENRDRLNTAADYMRKQKQIAQETTTTIMNSSAGATLSNGSSTENAKQAKLIIEYLENSADVYDRLALKIVESEDDLKRTLDLGIEAHERTKSIASQEEGEYKKINTVLKSNNKETDRILTNEEKTLYTIVQQANAFERLHNLKIPEIQTTIPKFGATKLATDNSMNGLNVGIEGFSDAKRYNDYMNRINAYNSAIEKQTVLYGEQSKVVQDLTKSKNEYMKMEGVQLKQTDNFNSSISSLSSSLSVLSSELGGMSDNPGIRALASSLAILSAIKAISTATTWYEYIAAGVAVTASTVSMFNALSGKKFAGGGIVGDRNLARVNEGEMILNSDQQRRLFQQINGEGSNAGNSNVVFRLKGQELVGLIDNYNKKYKINSNAYN
jgi:hypothetical protein